MTLDQFIMSRRAQVFAYFENDCAGFAADWVAEKTGADPLADLRAAGAPLAERQFLSAWRIVRRAGGLQSAATARLGASKPGLMAQRGDVCLVTNGQPIKGLRGHSFGVCTGGHIAVPGLQGLDFVPVSLGVAAWAI